MADLQEHPNATGLEHPYATGLGWADGMGLGQQHATHNTGSYTGLASWLGGWDGPGRPYYISTIYCIYTWDLTYTYVEIGDPTLGPPANQALVWVGWLGQVESSDSTSITHTVHHCSEPGLGWAVGTGLGHGFNTCYTSSPPQ
ncbi:hypothetical protein CBS147482_9208 [Aspergillus niger]|nr:hypothetical protein CBS147482_9208 [Aspergillus niger]